MDNDYILNTRINDVLVKKLRNGCLGKVGKFLVSMSAGARLRQLMREGGVMLPGAYDGLVARQARAKGFQGLYLSGAAVSASYGVPDVGLLSLDHFKAKIRELSVASEGLPILADADTGFGEIEMTARTVREYFHAGAAGLHLEDQVFPKRCGHLDGKELVRAEDFIEKLRRAKQAATASPNSRDFVICARTDARGVEGFDAAVGRATRYVLEGGADMVFPEGLTNIEEFREFSAAMRRNIKEEGKRPFLVANMTEFGKTEFIKFSDFVSAGYHAVIYPVSTLRAAMKNVESCLEELKQKEGLEEFVKAGGMQSRKELYKLLKYKPGEEWSWPTV